LDEKLWAKVDKTDDCWLWTGAKTSSGYGMVSHDSGVRPVHRVVYELLVGSIPDGLVIDHLCSVRNCVNPAHLEPVTNAENVSRGMRRIGRTVMDLPPPPDGNNPLEVVGLVELADLLAIPRGTVRQWYHRGQLPQPDALLAATPVWRLTTIEAWRR
jgi:hypothetical protein